MDRAMHHVTVAGDLRHLVPIFVANRAKELEALRAALTLANFELLRQLGSRMKGVGIPYGFQRISDLGEHVVAGAEAQDRAALETTITEYAGYLAGLQVSYAD
jgi:hypothetical protein